jgi:hypothetical protein
MSIQINAITSTDESLRDLVWQINDRLDYIARQIGREVLLPSDTSISVSRDENNKNHRISKAIVARKIKLSEVNVDTVRKNTVFIDSVDGHAKLKDRDGVVHDLTETATGGGGCEECSDMYLGINATAANSYLLGGKSWDEFSLASHTHEIADVNNLQDKLDNKINILNPVYPGNLVKVSNDGNLVDAGRPGYFHVLTGPTADRPTTGVFDGLQYLDTDKGFMVTYLNNNWVNMTGAIA